MMHRDGWNGPRASSAIPFAWFCWNREYGGAAIVDRIGDHFIANQEFPHSGDRAGRSRQMTDMIRKDQS
jgi:hypothetical protein